MRLRIIPCAIIALLLSSSAFAQYLSDQEADKTEKRVAKKKIILSKEAIFPGNEAGTRKIARITVVNKLWDTTRLGFLQVGMFNTKAEAVPDKDYSAWFQEFVNEAFANQFQASGPSLLWVIEDLRIGERTGGMSEKAFTRFKATAYLSTDGNRYKLLAASDDATQNGGMDVTHKHKNNIAKAFKQFYLLSLSKLDSVLTDQQGATLSYDDVIASFDRKRAIPVLTQPVKDGIYLSFLDFRENKPLISNFEIEQTKGAVVTAIEADGGKRRIADYWGSGEERGDL